MNEGTACTATYNCANKASTSGSEGACTYTCRYSGTQTASGSTTSAAQSAAAAKCTCTKTYSYKRTCSGSCSGSEGRCTYTGTYTGGGTGTGSSCSAAQSNAASCTCGSKTYKHYASYAAETCNTKCPNGGSSNGVAITTTGSGSTCAAAYDDAIKKREAEFDANYTKYCDCKSAVNQWTSTSSITSCTSYSIEVRVCAVKTGNPAATTMRYGLRRNGVAFGSPGEYSKRVSPTASNNCDSNSFSTNGVPISNCNGISIWVTFD